MRYRTLGATGLRVSEIGFGTWGLGGAANGAVAYGPTQDSQSIAALHAGRELGINFFDTADFYGFGHSEEVLAAAFGAMRGEVVIASKGGMLADGSQDFSPRHLRSALERSLRRLRSEYVDLYQLHSPSVAALRNQELRRELESFQAQGKVRAFGVSARSPEEALVAVSELGFKCVQANFSLVDQRALQCGLFEACRFGRAGVIARTPLCFGFLTGRYSAASAFDAHDHRNRWPPEQRERWADALGLFVTAMTRRPGETPAQFALRFCLSYPEVASAIPGMLTPEHVRENAGASDLGPLAPEAIAQIGAVYRRHAFFVGA